MINSKIVVLVVFLFLLLVMAGIIFFNWNQYSTWKNTGQEIIYGYTRYIMFPALAITIGLLGVFNRPSK